MLVQPALREYRTWIFDSRRWAHYQPRPDDIVIATYPKCGTTWTQRIVGLLVFQTPEPRPVMNISAWIDRRFPQPIEAVIAQIEAQTHRRFLKSHLPLDGLPLYDEVKYIHVARDGRDVCMSYHHHCRGFTDATLAALNKSGMDDESFARPYPAIAADPGEFFHHWITTGATPDAADGSPAMSFFHFEKTWWDARARPNVLLVHYNDLKADLPGEMRRIAEFLDISTDAAVWPSLVEAAGFDAMRRDADVLVGATGAGFKEGGRTFVHKGINERWRGVVSDADLALYERKAAAAFSPECARWVAQGRLRAGDPR